MSQRQEKSGLDNGETRKMDKLTLTDGHGQGCDDFITLEDLGDAITIAVTETYETCVVRLDKDRVAELAEWLNGFCRAQTEKRI
jgi:hypothetical protein